MLHGGRLHGTNICQMRRSIQKRYICVFACLSSRAVHLEVAHSLHAYSFLQAFSRFVGGRSRPTEVCSDNGSNVIALLVQNARCAKLLKS